MRAVERLKWMLSGAALCLLLLYGCSVEELAQQETTPTARAGQEQQATPEDQRAEPNEPAGDNQPVTAPPAQEDESVEIISTVYDKVDQSVVRIDVVSNRGGGIGTGFVYDNQGHIVTNYHVIAGSGAQIKVSFPDQEDYLAEVVGVDQDADLAVLRVRDIDPSTLVPLELGDSSQLRVGQMAIAIGNPLGEERTVTSGIISAVRAAKAESNDPGTFSIPGVIQTDAAINPGNSGGPLLDADGRVVGVNTFIANPTGAGGNIGIGFAVPVNLVKKVVPSIIQNGDYVHPYLGVHLGDVTRLTAIENNLPTKGVLVSGLTPSGPAAQGGIRENDIILAINDQQVLTSGDVISYLEFNTSPGDIARFRVVDPSGNEREVDVEIGARP